jgi:hypothetical protein
MEIGDAGAARLAEAVIRYREEVLAITQGEAAKRGGISVDRWQAVERGQTPRYTGRIIKGIETGLGLGLGAVRRLLDDGEAFPPPSERPERLPIGLDIHTASDTEIRALLEQVQAHRPHLMADVVAAIIQARPDISATESGPDRGSADTVG